MPEKLKARLIKTAKSKFPKNKKRQDAYVYGTLHKTGTQEGSVITRRRKRKAREIRPQYPSQKETHRMTDDIKDNPTGVYKVWPSVTFDKDGNKIPQTKEQAKKAGEIFEFTNKRKAKRFAHGSWKKGLDKREAMKAYRQSK